MQKVQIVQIEDLLPHQDALQSYAKKDLSNLSIVMKFTGRLLEPVKGVYRDGKIYIIDGLSRYYVALELKWESLDVEVLELTDEQVTQELVLRNVKSKRSLMETCKHAEMILGVLGMSQGKKRKTIGSIEMDDNEFGTVGKDRFELAAAVAGVDFSATTLRRLIAIKEFEENGDDEAKGFQLLDKLERGLISPYKAYEIIRKYQEEKNLNKSNAVMEGLDFYKGNYYTLYNKTCEDLQDIPNETVSICVTSSPYFKQRNYPIGKIQEGAVPHGEESSVEAFVSKQVEVANNVRLKLKSDGSYFMIIADSYRGKHCLVTQKLIIAMVEDGWYFNDEWIWKKNQKPQTVHNRLLPNFERILHFTKHPTDFYFKEFKYWIQDEKFGIMPSSNKMHKEDKKEKTWSLKRPLERFKTFLEEQHVAKIIESSTFHWKELEDVDSKFRHLAPYPSYIPLLPILMCSRPGDTVLDIYSGTGTTAAVAVQLGRNAIGYDTDTTSHNFACKRLKLVEEYRPNTKEIADMENNYMEAA